MGRGGKKGNDFTDAPWAAGSDTLLTEHKINPCAAREDVRNKLSSHQPFPTRLSLRGTVEKEFRKHGLSDTFTVILTNVGHLHTENATTVSIIIA